MKFITKIYITFSFLLIFFSCEEKLIAEEPAYIEINNFDYYGNNSTALPHPNGYSQFNSTNISDVWISMDGQIIGNYEIPSRIPILSEGNHSFDIYPGIKVNGISGARIKYPFYQKFTTDILLIKNECIEIIPKTQYIDNLPTPYFNTKGQFESSGTMFEKHSLSDTTAIMQNEVVFQGEKSAAIFLNNEQSYFDIRNIEPLELTNNTFLELNFLSSINFNVGLIILNPGSIEIKEELIQLYKTREWKKIYLDLGPLVSLGNSYSMFKIYFEGTHNENDNESSVYLDNLKLLHQ